MTQEPTTYEQSVRIIGADGTDTQAVFTWGMSDEACVLTLQFGTKKLSATESDYFEALCALRKILEPAGLVPFCYGASKNCFPSGMCRDMGAGMRVYKLVLSKPAKQSDLVSIFDGATDVELCTVAEQRAFFDQWIASLIQRTTE